MAVLVVARVIQGFGAGAIPAVAYVSIGRALPERLRPRMFATLSTAWVLPGVIGPILAGVVAEHAPLAARLPRPAAADRVAALPDPAGDPRGRAGRADDGGGASTRSPTDARRRLPLALVLVARRRAGRRRPVRTSVPLPLVLIVRRGR